MEECSALLAICAGNSPVPGEFPAQRPITQSFEVFFDLRLNKRFCKQGCGWWFETLSCPLWRHCNDYRTKDIIKFISPSSMVYMYANFQLTYNTMITSLYMKTCRQLLRENHISSSSIIQFGTVIYSISEITFINWKNFNISMAK